MGANQFKQYSMVRANSNDGFVYSGTTKGPNGLDVIHILKTDDNLNTIWSYYYQENTLNTLNSTKICKTYNSNGYWISGYHSLSGTKHPFILQINNLGVIVQQTEISQPGVFLDIEPTGDDGCIAVGFQSNSDILYAPSGRIGLIVKLTSSLGVTWARTFQSSSRPNPVPPAIPDNYFYESAVDVTVVKDPNPSSFEHYLVLGNSSELDNSSPPIRRPRGYWCYMRFDGTNFIHGDFNTNQCPLDGVYDVDKGRVFIVGKFDTRSSSATPFLGEFDVPSGSLLRTIDFEGSYTGWPFPHNPMAYKIDVVGDDLWLLGYVRENNDNGTNNLFGVMIPFRARINKISMAEIDFYVNHRTNAPTNNYPSEDPGFLNAWDNLYAMFNNYMPSIYVPEMGCVYNKNTNNPTCAMVGYFDSPSLPVQFDLHLINIDAASECNNIQRNLEIFPPINPPTVTVTNDFNFINTRSIIVSQYNLTLYSDACSNP
jgi:hypothetical protein